MIWAYLNFKNKFTHISIIDEASDFKFGGQLGFAKAYNKIPTRRKKYAWSWARGAPQYLLIFCLSYNPVIVHKVFPEC